MNRPPTLQAGLASRVAEHLSLYTRRSRPITKAVLGRRLNVTTRQIELAAQALRVQGEPICSDGRGYWWTRSDKEVKCQIERQRSRIITMFGTYKGLKKARRRLREHRGPRQTILFPGTG